jgi:hypothetical protein
MDGLKDGRTELKMDGRMDEKKELMNTKDTWTEG